MKKRYYLFALMIALTVMTAISLLTSCQNSTDNGKPTIVCTIFPEYDFTMNILGEKAELFKITLLNCNGTDMHSYQPTVSDIAQISSCSLFIYEGESSQNWVNNILKNVDQSKTLVLSMSSCLEERLECNESGHDHNHDHEYDEHVWLSLVNAQLMVDSIYQNICKIDPENKDYYESNKNDYVKKLSELNSDLADSLNTAKYSTLMFADRFPFLYLLKDHGIDYIAAFTGCSTESDAGVKTILNLADNLNTLELPAVIVIESSNNTIASTVIAESGRENVSILTLNSCQTITKSQIENGLSYIDIMENNIKNIKIALGCGE